jgi:hypothetical protein
VHCPPSCECGVGIAPPSADIDDGGCLPAASDGCGLPLGTDADANFNAGDDTDAGRVPSSDDERWIFCVIDAARVAVDEAADGGAPAAADCDADVDVGAFPNTPMVQRYGAWKKEQCCQSSILMPAYK